MKKIKIISWILGLIVLSAPAGFLILIIDKPSASRGHYTENLIMVTIAMVILLGSISLVTYLILNKRKSEISLKRALQVYTFFIACFFIYGLIKLPSVLKKRDRYDFIEHYEDRLTKVIMEKVAEESDHLPPAVLKHIEDITSSVMSEITYQEDIFERLMKSKDPESFVVNDPKMKQLRKEWIDYYKRKDKKK